jgi:hypothetical protein
MAALRLYRCQTCGTIRSVAGQCPSWQCAAEPVGLEAVCGKQSPFNDTSTPNHVFGPLEHTASIGIQMRENIEDSRKGNLNVLSCTKRDGVDLGDLEATCRTRPIATISKRPGARRACCALTVACER